MQVSAHDRERLQLAAPVFIGAAFRPRRFLFRDFQRGYLRQPAFSQNGQIRWTAEIGFYGEFLSTPAGIEGLLDIRTANDLFLKTTICD